MADSIQVTINGQTIDVPRECTVASAVLRAGHAFTRRSVTGEPRAPLCGMGICFECRLTINGQPQQKSCQILCTPGMEIRTND